MKVLNVKKIKNKKTNQSIFYINRKGLSKEDLDRLDKCSSMKIKIKEFD